jgi:hypothetical protein
MEKNPDPGSRINILDHISECLVKFFKVKTVLGSGSASAGQLDPDPDQHDADEKDKNNVNWRSCE